MRKLIGIMIVLAVFAACNSGMNNDRGTTVNGKNEKIDRSQRTVIDSAKYIDFTLRENNAARFSRQDIMYGLNDTYRLKGGNSYISIDRKDGTVTLSSDDAWYKDSGGHNMYAKYSFDVQAANDDCLYIKMDSKRKAQLIIDHEVMVNHAVPDLLVCVPLYGFSRNRIEVSPIMDGYIAMPSGTYWVQKK